MSQGCRLSPHLSNCDTGAKTWEIKEDRIYQMQHQSLLSCTLNMIDTCRPFVKQVEGQDNPVVFWRKSQQGSTISDVVIVNVCVKALQQCSSTGKMYIRKGTLVCLLPLITVPFESNYCLFAPLSGCSALTEAYMDTTLGVLICSRGPSTR